LKIGFKNKSSIFFSQEVSMIANKSRSSMTFSLLFQMKWIKAFHVDKNIIYEKKTLKKKYYITSFFVDFFCYLVSSILSLVWYNFALGQWLKWKLYSHKANVILYLKKSRRKLCQKLRLHEPVYFVPCRDIGTLGFKICP